MLSHYVHREGDVLFNTVTTEILPADSDESTLRKHYFLNGQEQDAVHDRLFNTPIEQIGLKVIPTWKCNLRCRHCFVLHKLVKEDNNVFDTSRFVKFIDSIIVIKSLKKIGLGFIGGEAALAAAKCVEIYDAVSERIAGSGVILKATTTTNGTVWDRDVAELFSRMNTITVSLDGNSTMHNKQRKGLNSLQGEDLYRITLRNIKRMVLMGFGEKMLIQAALYDDVFKAEFLKDFYRDLLSCGIGKDKILVGSAVPTRINADQSDLYRRYLATYIYNRPCCKYRLGREFVIDSNGDVYCDYFDHAQTSRLGTLETDIGEIVEGHKRLIMDTMPVLNDNKCKSCPVIGACWGRCCNTEFLRPSEHCDQTALYDLCQQNAAEGKLISHFKANKK